VDSLQAKRLQKNYNGRQVVRDVSMQIGRTEIGPNGAGKTTCFYMIVGLVKADFGSVIIDQTDVTGAPIHERARRGLAYLPQDSSIFRTLSVEDNILAILETRKDLDKPGRNRLLETLLEEFHISHLRNNRGMSLSGGERRRTEIARALATDPKFILLDEPFAGVDPISVSDIKQIIEHLKQRGIGILLTDHNVRDTLDICDRAYVVSEGLVIAEGNRDVILNDPKVRDVYLGEKFRL
jgi:lipopolysaccharide export system ATP-binding protein